MAGKAIPLSERFHKHYIPEPNSGCWLWLSATVSSKYGGPYGVIGADKGDGQKMFLAHRASYQLHVEKIPDDFQIDHTCKNTLCVNPEHLEKVTSKEHCRRTTDRRLQGACTRGHLMNDKNVWIEKSGYRHCRSCHVITQAAYVKRRKARLLCTEID